MTPICQDRQPQALQAYRLAVQLYEMIAERHGVHDELSVVALELVEATGLASDAPEVYFASRSRFLPERAAQAGRHS